MIEVKHLTKNYASKLAVNDISFTVNDGEILGFLGPNGAGKSTTMNILTGYISATDGEVLINGIDILDEPTRAKKEIGYLPEIPPLYLDMSVNEYLNFIYDLKKCKLPKKAHIEEVCGLVKIKDVQNRLIKHLSKGYKQRVGMAQALIGNPEILILDEPTVGLDPKQILDIRNLIKRLGKKHTVILSSHILSEIQAVCDRIVIINKGEIAADDTTEHLSQIVTDDLRYTLRLDVGGEYTVEAPPESVIKVIETIDGVKSVDFAGSKEENTIDLDIEVEEGTDIRRELFRRMCERKWAILGLKSNQMSLEDIFLRITMGDQIDLGGKKKESAYDDPKNVELKKELMTQVSGAVAAVDALNRTEQTYEINEDAAADDTSDASQNESEGE
ncbi:MAG: ABC transporter ATP-binding protein [Oscillospiraceae bacterium]|nr:ATP-binding cassette domain-containing protein [Oscillospiraceae bacterium]MCR5806555.1 ABC transporter ATP-binding protein [Oscillospiraceae bacterium]